jgi:acyl-CoA synthetase (AMP-forming)/AMP-acid ligase II
MTAVAGENPLARNPDKPALIMGWSGEVVTYRELDCRSNQVAHLLRDAGLRAGDVVALCMDTNRHFHEILWGVQRSGLVYVPISNRLLPDEIAYVLKDSGARAIFATSGLGATANALLGADLTVALWFAVGGPIGGYVDYLAARQAMPETPIGDESPGRFMSYSSGTTGRPKGIVHLADPRSKGKDHMTMQRLSDFFEMNADTVYLSPAPLYHSAPLTWTMRMLRLGATSVLMDHFDAATTLALIEKHKITHAQFVPTMFVRMFKLPAAVRSAYTLSSLRAAIHAAAPCPVEVKEQMIAWWGPIIHEYYGASEGLGITALLASEWLTHRGSVGKPIFGISHIVDDEGREQPIGAVGTIWFEDGGHFDYVGDPQKTAESMNERGWRTVGDIGRLDADGFLYLTDRKSNMIISGGVNIYPQEAENLIITHPRVLDAAVIGVPDEEFGESVKAVVQLIDPAEEGEAMASDIIAFCRASLSPIKCPRSVDFAVQLPRHPNGKLYKRKLRDQYWAGRGSAII